MLADWADWLHKNGYAKIRIVNQNGSLNKSMAQYMTASKIESLSSSASASAASNSESLRSRF